MKVSYERLWKLMKSNKMKKKDLANAVGLSAYMMGQLSKNAFVSLEIVAKLCLLFHCHIEDVVEVIEE